MHKVIIHVSPDYVGQNLCELCNLCASENQALCNLGRKYADLQRKHLNFCRESHIVWEKSFERKQNYSPKAYSEFTKNAVTSLKRNSRKWNDIPDI